jgi:hypothetical protein
MNTRSISISSQRKVVREENDGESKSPPVLATPLHQTHAAASATLVTRSSSLNTPSNNAIASTAPLALPTPLALLADVCEGSTSLSLTTIVDPPFLPQEQDVDQPVHVINAPPEKMGIIIDGDGPQVVINGNDIINEDDIIFGLDNIDVFGNSTREFAGLLGKGKNNIRELIVLRNQPKIPPQYTKSGKPYKRWEFTGFMEYYDQNRDKFKSESKNHGSKLSDFISRMWTEYMALPSKERRNFLNQWSFRRGHIKELADRKKANPSKRPGVSGYGIFLSLNSAMLKKFYPNENIMTIASMKYNEISDEDRNKYKAVANLQAVLMNSFCKSPPKDIVTQPENNDLSSSLGGKKRKMASKSDESADPILLDTSSPGEPAAGTSDLLLYFILILFHS